MHHCYIGLPQRRIPLCHKSATACFFGAICGCGPITTLTRPTSVMKPLNLSAIPLRPLYSVGSPYTSHEIPRLTKEGGGGPRKEHKAEKKAPISGNGRWRMKKNR